MAEYSGDVSVASTSMSMSMSPRHNVLLEKTSKPVRYARVDERESTDWLA